MTKEIIRVHNAETGETIDREMTDEEYAAFLLNQETFRQLKLEEEQKELNKKTLLNRLGITEEEAKLLLS